MQINHFPVEIHLTIKADKPTIFHTRNLDFDLLKTKLTRLIHKYGEQTGISLDTLKIDSANVRSSLYINSLGSLFSFIDNLESYSNSQTSKEAIQAVSEYVGCFDYMYHKINATEVLSVISDIVIISYPRSQKPKTLDKNLPHPVEVATNWMVVLKD